MTTIDIDETTRNAILAALDERAKTLEWAVSRYTEQAELYRKIDRPLTEHAERALVWNTAALHETNMARLLVAEAEPASRVAPESETEKAAAWGR